MRICSCYPQDAEPRIPLFHVFAERVLSNISAPVEEFLQKLSIVAPPAGQGAYAFMQPDRSCRGWVQFIHRSASQIEIHRLWTLAPGKGHGTAMLGAVCELADSHGVEIWLKPLPFGRKPHPKSRDELMTWYQKYGFEGTRKRMIRKPALARV